MNNDEIIKYSVLGVFALIVIQQFYEMLLYGLIAICAWGVYQQVQRK